MKKELEQKAVLGAYAEATYLVEREHTDAMNKFPLWPVDILAGEVIVAEEVGEAHKAALDYVVNDGPIEAVILEHAQAAAMHIRQIQYLFKVMGKTDIGM